MQFQSTLPREERLNILGVISSPYHISIHAPTRGATIFAEHCNIKSHISIHAPTRGATYQAHQPQASATISIHAPTRGATSRYSSVLLIIPFQSTLPREERLVTHAITNLTAYFNPRSHERSDHSFYLLFRGAAISIHAPTRGATGRDRRNA